MIPKKEFGKTGHKSTRTIFGGASLWEVTQEEADRVLDILLKYNINHIDTGSTYGDSEKRIGNWMKNHRKDFFLATKADGRTYQSAKDELHQSLDLLNVDQIDLWQMHELHTREEWEEAFSAGGAIDAFIEAKEDGLVRFLGVTGHGLAAPKLHLKSLLKFNFDSVLLPYNYTMMKNPEYATDYNTLEKTCLTKNVAIQTIKSIARRGKGLAKHKKYNTWYNPLDNEKAIFHAVSWVLGDPNVFLNTVGDIHLLETVLKAASVVNKRPDNTIMEKDIEKFQIEPLFPTEEI
jgi:predicted aldo/keto reductase-like oxidoreductase